MPLILGNIGPLQILAILIIILLLFGARKLPELARSIGSAVTEFKRGLKDITKPEEEETEKSKSGSEVRSMAKEAGIDVEGKSDEELRKELVERSKK
ncbi:MAG: hypothetical protein A7316_00290 [Candidatus Altiarchaeales archaeon WOR_SM1_86-2]|nr:MAG: hypothetical protein A7316_00290 [Candidatus Altiarchaeales archaeon WOR_SM1_86-2]ODS41739.1 MAG: hypothetical protein A7315_00390 [Candidatus Altiarchaeales archaeon WOR_SM1_79]